MAARFLHTTFAPLIATAFLVSLPIISCAAFAQETPSAARPVPHPSLRFCLDKLQYDADTRGPLLVVAPDETLPPDSGAYAADADNEPEGSLSLATLARRSGRMVVRIGSLTVMAPLTMKVIEGHPEKADPFRGMWPNEKTEVLMGSFTREQWQQACSTEGIGSGDMKDDQKLLFDSLLPDKMDIDKIAYSANPEGGPPKQHFSRSLFDGDRASVRIRLNYQTSYFAAASGSKYGIYDPGEPNLDQHAGTTVLMMTGGYGTKADDRGASLYGVKIVKSVANRQKPGDIDYASARLDVPILVADPGSKNTIGELIARVDHATGLDIVPDRRVRDLAVYSRGISVRAGDLMQALALAVAGAYRRVGTTTAYVLTSDLDGIGTRRTRLQAWANDAEDRRRQMVDAALRHAATLNPLEFLTFAPDDPYALTSAQTEHLDDDYRNGAYDIDEEMKSDDLSPAMRDRIARKAESARTDQHILVDTSKVRMQLGVTLSYLIPGVGAVPEATPALMGLSPLTDTGLKKKPEPQPAATVLDWSWLKNPLQKRVLLVAASAAAANESLIAAAAHCGFTNVWLRVPLPSSQITANADDARTLLKAAVAAGKRNGVAIAAEIALLQTPEADSEAERNILGQTGAEFVADIAEQRNAAPAIPGGPPLAPSIEELTSRLANWNSLASDEIQRRLASLADISGLSGLVVTATAPPGFIATSDPARWYPFDPIPPGGEMGYTDERRSAFLHAAGFDPIDVPSAQTTLRQLDLSLRYFPDSGDPEQATATDGKQVASKNSQPPAVLWNEFREAENRRVLAALYESLQTTRTKLPLWIDDRTSDFRNVRASWFVSWDAADRLPSNVVSADLKAARAAAHTTSKTALLRVVAPTDMTADSGAGAATFFAASGAKALAEGWEGVVFDLSQVKVKDTTLLLQSIPESSARPGAAGDPPSGAASR